MTEIKLIWKKIADLCTQIPQRFTSRRPFAYCVVKYSKHSFLSEKHSSLKV